MVDEPKIIVDEDWKAQVQAEKEAAKRAAAGKAATPGAAEAGATRGPAPPATLEFLVTMLATEALISLGQAPNPLTGQVHCDHQQAKHFIDLLAMLEQKTAGNRTPQESQLLDDWLHQLRMAYVLAQQSPAAES